MTYTLEFSQTEKLYRLWLKDDISYIQFDTSEQEAINTLSSLPHVTSVTVQAFDLNFSEEILSGRTAEHTKALVEYLATVTCTNIMCIYQCITEYRELPMDKFHYLVHSLIHFGFTGKISKASSNRDLEFAIQYQNCLDYVNRTNSIATSPQVRQLLSHNGTLDTITKNLMDATMGRILAILTKNPNSRLLNCTQTPLIVVHALLNDDDLTVNELADYKPLHPSYYQHILSGSGNLATQAIKAYGWSSKPLYQ